MRCWGARGVLADLIEGSPSGARSRRAKQHVDSCPACRAMHDDLLRMSILAREAGQDLTSGAMVAAGFEERLMREIRSRSDGGSLRAAAPLLRKPLPLGAAIILMSASVLLALYFSGYVATDGFTPRLVAGGAGELVSSETADAGVRGDLDTLMPREVPFTLRQDLVGSRRGRIPLTSYVLEPAPEESAVVRASF